MTYTITTTTNTTRCLHLTRFSSFSIRHIYYHPFDQPATLMPYVCASLIPPTVTLSLIEKWKICNVCNDHSVTFEMILV